MNPPSHPETGRGGAPKPMRVNTIAHDIVAALLDISPRHNTGQGGEAHPSRYRLNTTTRDFVTALFESSPVTPRDEEGRRTPVDTG